MFREDKDASLSNWDSFDTTKLHELTNIRISKPFSHKECSVCNTNIKFGTTCCKCSGSNFMYWLVFLFYKFLLLFSVCRLTFHVNCIQSIPIPCLPRKETPKSISNKGRLRLGDFCPDVRPMIPHLLGHCTVYLERSEIPCDLYSSFGYVYGWMLFMFLETRMQRQTFSVTSKETRLYLDWPTLIVVLLLDVSKSFYSKSE